MQRSLFPALLFCVSLILFSGREIQAEGVTPYAPMPVDQDGRAVKLTLEQIIKFVLEHNISVRLDKYDIVKSDTAERKENSKYAPVIGGGISASRSVSNRTRSSIFQGTDQSKNKNYLYVEKAFSSGTFLRVEGSDVREDSNAGKETLTQTSAFSGLSRPPQHTGSVAVTLQQEFVKNAFGYSQRRIDQMARNNAAMQRQALTQKLSQLVVETMVDYWQLSTAEWNVKTATMLLDNVRNIRNVTINKRTLGLAEYFEVQQWDALLAQSESSLKQATLQRDQLRRNLLRVMNLAPDTRLTGATELREEMPAGVNLARDVELAMENRPDLKNLELAMRNSRMQLEIAENSRQPSVTLGGTYASRDYGRHGNTAFNQVGTNRYPEYQVELKASYPLWDEGNRVDARNARIDLRKSKLEEDLLRRQVADEVRSAIDEMQTSHSILANARRALDRNENYYQGLLYRYGQGRFTAVALKNALDAVAQSRNYLAEALIQFNISLVRYDLARNMVWKRYNIDIDKVIGELQGSVSD